MKQAVMLAGGKGTRLSARLGGMPKPMVDVCGIPLLERQLRLLEKHGFGQVLILVNHASGYILEYCASRRGRGIDIECIDDGEPRGTAGATLAIVDRLAEEFLVMYGDTMMEVNLDRFHSYHAAVHGTAATLFLHPNDHPHDSDLVETDDDGRVLAFRPYPHDSARYYPNLVNAALYWVDRKSLVPWQGNRRVMDFGKDLFPAMLERGMLLRGYKSPEYIKDVGTPARLDRVCADLLSGRIKRASLDHMQAMVFLDRDGTINQEVGHLRDREQMQLFPGAGHAIARLNASEYRCCVVTNQPVVARGECSFGDLREIHNKMETLLGRQGAFVDRIYFCPHHPDSGFQGERPELKVDCDCRKPNTGMIDRAVREFNVSRERSWLIGDSSVDMEVARRAGVRSILVETGQAGLDYRTWAVPDVTVPDLDAAVSFILDDYPRLLSRCMALAGPIREGDIVLIGGQSRSGKSTFASTLRDAIQKLGRRAWVLTADRWLKSKPLRGAGVMGRYDMPELQALVETLGDIRRRPAVLKLPGYHKLKQERVEGVGAISIAASDVVLLEGIVVLALQTPNAVGVHRFHVDIDEEERKRRVLKEYQLRGFESAQAMEVYRSRCEDEVPILERLAMSANRLSLGAMAP